MSRFRTAAVAVAAALLSSACYRVTVVTGAAPAATTVDNPWTHSFVYGLVPPQPINVASQCPQGVSRVMTERSFLNGLVGALTWSLYTPIHVNVTCGTGQRSSMGLPTDVLGKPATVVAPADTAATR